MLEEKQEEELKMTVDTVCVLVTGVLPYIKFTTSAVFNGKTYCTRIHYQKNDGKFLIKEG